VFRISLLMLGALVCGITLLCNPQSISGQSPATQNIELDNPVVPFGPNDSTLLIHDSKVLVNGDALLSVGGNTGGHVIWFYTPRYGRYIFSTRPHPNYQFREVEVIQNRRIVFESEGKRFEWIMSTPLTATGTILRLWMMHDKQPEPLTNRDTKGVVGAATHYEYVFTTPKQ